MIAQANLVPGAFCHIPNMTKGPGDEVEPKQGLRALDSLYILH